MNASKKAKKQKSTRSGLGLLEVMIAIGIFVTVSGGALLVMTGGQDLFVDAQRAGDASEYAFEGLQATNSIRDKNWGSLTDGSHGLAFTNNEWQFSGATDAKNMFTRTVTVAQTGVNQKIATTTVSWPAGGGSTEKIEFAQILSNVNQSGAGFCNFYGNWAHPQQLASVDIGAGRSGTDVAATSTYIFMSSTAPDATKKDLTSFDMTNPAVPVLKGEINTGGGINEFVLAGKYAYAASSDDSKEFIVIDVGNPALPVEVTSIDLGGAGNANTIAYNNGYVYIGRSYSSTYKEIEVINVTNPAAPSVATEINESASIMKMYAFNNKLYYSYYQLTNDVGVRDISNPPAAPFLTYWDIGVDDVYAMYADLTESNFYFGTDWGENFYTSDASNTSSLLLKDVALVDGRVWDIVANNGFAMLGTTNANAEFQVADINDPANISIISSMNLSQLASAIACKDNMVFIAVRSNDALKVIGPGP